MMYRNEREKNLAKLSDKLRDKYGYLFLAISFPLGMYIEKFKNESMEDFIFAIGTWAIFIYFVWLIIYVKGIFKDRKLLKILNEQQY